MQNAGHSSSSSATASCSVCGGEIKCVRTVPKLGPHPELRTYQCRVCDAVETFARQAGAAAVARAARH